MIAKAWIAASVGLVATAAVWLACDARAQFIAGGAMVNAGFRMQDHLEDYDLAGDETHHPSVEVVLQRLLQQNEDAAEVRSWFPRTSRHPLVATVLCMDARLDSAELMGDTRKYYYTLRTAGSVLSESTQDMLALAVANGVRVIVWTTHTDCAAEKVANSPQEPAKFPHLRDAVHDREAQLDVFLHRPDIAPRLADGTLSVVTARVDTETGRLADVHQYPQRLGRVQPNHAH